MASNKVRIRTTGQIKEVEETKAALFLYDNLLGRLILKLLIQRPISSMVGFFMNSLPSKFFIKNFIEKNKINMEDYPLAKYPSFNDFFVRKINPEKRPIDALENILISPADAKLSVFKIDETNEFKIKNSFYKVEDLINDQEVAKEYINGYALIFRLCVDDYHRYCYIDDGNHDEPKHIKGELHAVRPLVLKYYNIYKRNNRVWTKLNTKNFGEVIQVEIGALMVGKIHNFQKVYEFKKGEEKGYFRFGGSTIVLLFKENSVVIDEDLLYFSKYDMETEIKYGEKIGIKKQDIERLD